VNIKGRQINNSSSQTLRPTKSDWNGAVLIKSMKEQIEKRDVKLSMGQGFRFGFGFGAGIFVWSLFIALIMMLLFRAV